MKRAALVALAALAFAATAAARPATPDELRPIYAAATGSAWTSPAARRWRLDQVTGVGEYGVARTQAIEVTR